MVNGPGASGLPVLAWHGVLVVTAMLFLWSDDASEHKKLLPGRLLDALDSYLLVGTFNLEVKNAKPATANRDRGPLRGKGQAVRLDLLPDLAIFKRKLRIACPTTKGAVIARGNGLRTFPGILEFESEFAV